MPKGRIGAAVKAIAESVAKGLEDAAATTRSLAEKGADAIERNLKDHHTNDQAVRDRLHAAAGERPGGGKDAGVVLHSRSGALSNREVLERGVGLPRTPETIQHYAERAGVDFHGTPVEVVESADDVAYLDFQGAVARTDSLGVQLGPAAFQDEETLVRTLGHESVHVVQHQQGRITTMTGPLEDEAYAAEDGFVATWRGTRS